MAYDRYDTRDDHPRWRDSRHHDEGRDRSRPQSGDERSFFERAGDEIASWFGDDHDGRRHRDDHGSDRGRGWAGRSSGWDDRERSSNRDDDRGYGRDADRDRGADRDRSRALRGGRDETYQGTAWPSSERDYNRQWRDEIGWERGDDWGRERKSQRGSSGDDRGYRPVTGDYGRSERVSGSEGYGASAWDRNRDRNDREGRSEWERDEYRSSSRAGTREKSDRSRDFDPHYHSWRERHLSELDRDYDDYRREHQSKFENDFSSWRERRTQKRGLLGQIREHMEVVGKDDQHVGTVDKVAGDRIILTKSDPESGGVHHSLNCHHVDRVEGDRVILDCSADEARRHWRDESRSRALFEREDQGDMGDHALNQAFGGTYR